MNTFATRLRQAMFVKEVRQVDLVNRTGINKARISRWVNGENIPYGEGLKKLADALGVTVDWLLGKDETPIRPKLPTIHEVNVIGRVAAGVPMEAQEDVIGSIVTDKEVFALKVKGDSMSPRIMDGDIVLVHQQDFAEDGDVVIALVDGEATCKVLKRNRNAVTLVPFNGAYTPFVYTGSDAEDLKILGKVVESRHEW